MKLTITQVLNLKVLAVKALLLKDQAMVIATGAAKATATYVKESVTDCLKNDLFPATYKHHMSVLVKREIRKVKVQMFKESKCWVVTCSCDKTKQYCHFRTDWKYTRAELRKTIKAVATEHVHFSDGAKPYLEDINQQLADLGNLSNEEANAALDKMVPSLNEAGTELIKNLKNLKS
jgi:hypothetical protein